MLLDNKIQELIDNKVYIYDKDLTVIINELSLHGTVDSTVMLQLDILYHLIEQEFPLDHLNLELYKKIESILNTTKDYVADSILTELVNPSTGLPFVIVPNSIVLVINGVPTLVDSTTHIPIVVGPTITVSETITSFDDTYINKDSVVQFFTFIGDNLIDPIIVAVTTGFEISLDPVVNFTNSLLFIPNVNNRVTTQTVYLRFSPVTSGNIEGMLSLNSTSAVEKTIALSGTALESLITISDTLLTFDPQNLSKTPVVKSYTVEGVNLQSPIVITASTSYLVSLSNSTGFTTSLSLNPVAGIITTTTVYVKFVPIALTTYTTTISHTSLDAVTKNIVALGTGVNAVITTIPTSLDFTSQQIGGTTAPQSFIVTGLYLVGDITITAPARFKVCKTSGGTYETSLTLPPTLESVDAIIYCKFSPTVIQDYTDVIQLTATTATTVEVNVIGTGLGVPIITVDPTSIPFGNIPISSSDVLVYKLIGTYLLGDLTIESSSPTSIYGYSLDGATYAATLTITPISGLINRWIYVQFTPIAEATYNTTIEHTSSGATQVDLALTGTGITASAVITLSGNSLTFASTEVDTESAEQTLTIEGTSLTGDITVYAPSGYKVSKTTGTGFGSSVVYTQVGGTIATSDLFIIFSPSLPSEYVDDILCKSDGAITKAIAVTGTGTQTVVEVFNYSSFLQEWVVPVGCTSILVECYGAGSSGAGRASIGTSVGGSSGAYAASTLTVVLGTEYTIIVGKGGVGDSIAVKAGGYSSFGSLVLAIGGSTQFAPITGCIGTTKYYGGNGGTPNSTWSGAGAGSAGINGPGNSANGNIAGTGNGGYAGNGGAGVGVTFEGSAGSVAGGGGSGSKRTSGTLFIAGGNGGDGKVILTYTINP